MKVGLHVSAAGGVASAPKWAIEYGAECFQFFSRPPQGGPAKPLSNQVAEEFQALCQKKKLSAYIHAPYYINLASANSRIFYGSISVLKDELRRANQLGGVGVVTHLGSAKDLGKKALAKVGAALAEILKDYSGKAFFMAEIAAGSGAIIGDSFAEIAAVIRLAEKKIGQGRIKVCFDTAHAFASGYDLRTKKSVTAVFKDFDREIGLARLSLIHINDSAADFTSQKDRHAHLGQGKIGLLGLAAVVAWAKKLKVDLILETEHDGGEIADLALLKKFRK